MTNSTVKHLPLSEIELTITIPTLEISKSYEKVLAEVVKNTELKGFRKGKAPRDLVEKSLESDKIYQEVVRDVLPQGYSQALTQHDLHPIVDPQITIIKPEKLSLLAKGEDLVVKAKTATKPKVNLKDYQEKIKSLKAKKAIWVPGKGKPEDKKEDEKTDFNEVITVFLETVEVELPPLLVEHEANRLLAQTLAEIKKLGLTLEQYLSSTGKTAETVKAEASQKALSDLKLEFALAEIAHEEKITVSKEDIEKVISENKDPKVQENLRGQSYLLASILLQQKTLDFLKAL